MNTAEKFSKDGYIVVRNVISEELVKDLAAQFFLQRDRCHYFNKFNEIEKDYFSDDLVKKNAFTWYAPYDHLLLTLKPKIEEITGLELIPTYTFGRIYYKNAEMSRHIDRKSCEISMTLCITFDKKPWPIWIENKQGFHIPVELFPGDAMIYKGLEIPHWRNPYLEGEEQMQFFLHWVDASGPYTSMKYDKRPMLGLENESTGEEIDKE